MKSVLFDNEADVSGKAKRNLGLGYTKYRAFFYNSESTEKLSRIVGSERMETIQKVCNNQQPEAAISAHEISIKA